MILNSCHSLLATDKAQKPESGSAMVLVWCVRKKCSWSRHWLFLLWRLFQFASTYLHLWSLQVTPREISTCICSIMVLTIVHLLLLTYSTFLACTAKPQQPSTIAKMDSEWIPTKAAHLGPLPFFTDGKHHSMVTVSLYLAIKVIHSHCYTADLFRIPPTARPKADKLLVWREISPP